MEPWIAVVVLAVLWIAVSARRRAVERDFHREWTANKIATGHHQCYWHGWTTDQNCCGGR